MIQYLLHDISFKDCVQGRSTAMCLMIASFVFREMMIRRNLDEGVFFLHHAAIVVESTGRLYIFLTMNSKTVLSPLHSATNYWPMQGGSIYSFSLFSSYVQNAVRFILDYNSFEDKLSKLWAL